MHASRIPFQPTSRQTVGRPQSHLHSTVLKGNNANTVVERRAADVVVLGDSALALAASFSLARRGKKVIHVPDLGIKSQAPRPEALKPICIMDITPQLVSMADESLSYLQGLELQAVTPLLLPSKSLHLATRTTEAATDRSGLGPLTGSELLAHLQSVCKQAGLKVSSVSPADLLTPYPMFKLPNNTHGLLQAEGGVIDAAGVTAAIKVLGQRLGVQLRDAVVLQGWIDTGSSFKVRVASRLQPDAVSEYEAEQLLVAPGAWPKDSLRLFNLELPGLKLQRRAAIRCPAASQLTKIPITTHWNDAAPSESTVTSATSTSSLNTKGSASAAARVTPLVPVRTASSESDPGKNTQSKEVDSEGMQRVASWTLYPRMKAASSCKLTAQTGASSPQLLDSCWQLHTDHIIAQAIRAAQDGDMKASQQQATQGASGTCSLESQWIHASGIIKGLAPPRQSNADEDDDDEGVASDDKDRQGGNKGNKVQEAVAWDAVTADGLPILGWHPGFEEGRVLVACTAGGNVAAHDSCSTTTKTDSKQGSEVKGRDGSSTSSNQTGSAAEQGKDASVAKPEPDVREWVGSCSSDGYHLSPLLAKVASDMLLGDSLSTSVDIASLSPARAAVMGNTQDDVAGEGNRTGSSVASSPVSRDTWDHLGQIQDGTVFFDQLQQLLTEDERQALDELRVLAKHGNKQVVQGVM